MYEQKTNKTINKNIVALAAIGGIVAIIITLIICNTVISHASTELTQPEAPVEETIGNEVEDNTSANTTATPARTPKTKKSLKDLFVNEPSIDAENVGEKVEALPADEMLEVLPEVFDILEEEGIEPEIHAENVIAAIEEVNNDRIEKALEEKKNGTNDSMTDVGESIHETAKVVETPSKKDIDETNGVVAVDVKSDSITVVSDSKKTDREFITVINKDGSSKTYESNEGAANNVGIDENTEVVNIYRETEDGVELVGQTVIENNGTATESAPSKAASEPETSVVEENVSVDDLLASLGIN